MKTIYKIIPIAALGILSLSCNKFLDREPLSDVTPEQFFNTESDLASYTITRYDFPTHNNSYNAGTFTYDNGTDNQAEVNPSKFWKKNEIKVLTNKGDFSFDKIRNINYFLQQVEPKYVSKKIIGNEANIRHYIGEAYFLRAYEYFKKLKIFGDYPIIKEIIPDDKAQLVEAAKRRPRNEVARFIIEDLDKAISMLKNSPVENKNRISKEVALLFRSRVALYEGTWLKYHKGTARVPGGNGWPGAKMNYLSNFSINIDEEINFFLTEAMKSAKEIADKIQLTDSNHQVSGTKIFENPYYKMFADLNLGSYSEVIFWRQFDEKHYGHHTNHYLTRGAGSGYTRGFMESFLMKSGLPIYASTSGYQGDELIENVKKDRDERLQLFMRAPGDYITIAPKEIKAKYPDLLDKPESRSVTGYDIHKGVFPNSDYLTGEVLTTTGSIVFRASEAYLNYIEACYEKNNSLDASAMSYWKKLRARAGLPDDYMTTVNATDLSKENDFAVYSAGQKVDKTLYNIRRERRCEFIAEGMRLDDLKRWRALDQVKNYQIEGINLWAKVYDNERYYEKDAKGEFKLDKDGKKISLLKTLPDSKPVVSSKSLSTYLRPYQVVQANNLYYDGYTFPEAHYLSPIAYEHFVISSTTGDISSTVIYQNPGWPVQANGNPL